MLGAFTAPYHPRKVQFFSHSPLPQHPQHIPIKNRSQFSFFIRLPLIDVPVYILSTRNVVFSECSSGSAMNTIENV